MEHKNRLQKEEEKRVQNIQQRMRDSQKKLEKNLKQIQDGLNYRFGKKDEKTALVNKDNQIRFKNWETKTDQEYRKILEDKRQRAEARQNQIRNKSANIYKKI